jgi:ABC-2 type transport system ATP-binding protein
MEEYFLETNNLSKSFGKQIAVHNVSLRVKENTINELLGPNGAGNSTIFKLLTGLLGPTNGEIIFNGHSWSRKDL